MMGTQFDPSRLIKKLELATQIDAAQIELAREEARRVREQLTALGDGSELVHAVSEADQAIAAAEQAYRQAQQARHEARDRLTLYQERQRLIGQLAQRAEAQAERWGRELAKEQAQLEDAQRQARIGAISA